MPTSNPTSPSSSSGGGFSFKVTKGGSFTRLPLLLAEEYTLALERIGDRGADKLKGLFRSKNINASGKTSQSIRRDEVQRSPDGSQLSVRVGASGSRQQILRFVEFGRKPQRTPPPVRAILEWMDDKGIGSGMDRKQRRTLAFFIAQKIGAEGIQGKYVVRQTRAYVEQLTQEEIQAATARALARLKVTVGGG